jgi:hypothetical protein
MITNDDWNAALDSWVAAERERLGGLPSIDEVVACVRDELPDGEAERVRALLVYYPELTQLLEESMPVEERGEARWHWRRPMSVAAGVVIALLSGAVVESRWEIAKLHRDPYVHESRHELRPARLRGGALPPPYELPAGEERYLLAPMLIAQAEEYRDYRIELVDVAAERVIWTTSGVQPVNGVFELSIPRRFLRETSYQLNVYGLAGGEAHALESFRFRVPRRR